MTVYFVLRDIAGAETNVTFLIDGEVRGDIVRPGTAPSVQWVYNYPAFTAGGLSNDVHTLTIQGGSPNLFIFDYFTYEQPIGSGSTATTSGASSTPSGTSTATSHSNSTAVIAASVAAVVVVVAIAGIVAAVLLMRKRRRRQSGEQAGYIS